MKIIHVPYTYYPDPVGGTEIYVEQLAEHLRAQGIENVVVAPGAARATYKHRGIVVERLAVEDAIRDVAQLYGEGDADAAACFGALLDAHAPQLVHLHAFTRIVSTRLIEQAHRRGVPVVFTYHTPTVSCMRSGLMMWGRQACDGVLDAARCTCCRLHSLGAPRPVAELVARTPPPLRAFGKGRSHRIWTALRMVDLVANQHAATRALFSQVDAIVALCEWTRQLLLKNQITSEKIFLAPHGFTPTEQKNLAAPDIPKNGSLRVVSLGRLEPIKGVDLLVRALAQLPAARITLDIYGIEQGETETVFARHLRREIARDARIRLLPPVPHEQVTALLRGYHVLAAPSQWFETGPLVVLEAFAAGIPVVGSNLGGIAEKVQDGVNGLLVSSLDVNAWRAALNRLATDRALLEHLRAGVQPPRSMEQVAQDMTALYETLLAKAQP